MMQFRALLLGTAMTLGFAGNASATIIGATYDFTTSTTGVTQISPFGGPTTHTDPANPGFCVGPPVTCGQGSGLSGSFAFSNVGPNLDRITFTFFGSTDFAVGTFSIQLGNFSTVDGEVITGVSYNSGNLFQGDFTNVTFDGVNAIFTGSTASVFNAIGGTTVTFNVATREAPEPAALLLLGFGSLAAGVYRRRR